MYTNISERNLIDLGVVGYQQALNRQKSLMNDIFSGRASSTVFVLEHEPVITIGRSKSVLNSFDKKYFEKKALSPVHTDRGGGITFHSPGQLIVYPVLDLECFCRKDVKYYIDTLEIIASEALLLLGAKAERLPEKRGVWVSGKKVAFTGVAFKKWITYHGLSVNINNDIEPFRHMNVCGEKDVLVTSLSKVAKRKFSMDKAKNVFMKTIIDVISRRYPIRKERKVGNTLI